MAEFLKIGYIRSHHGLKGLLKVKFTTDRIPAVNDELYFEKTSRLMGPHSLLSVQQHGQDWIVGVTGCTDIEQAKEFTGSSIGIHAPHLEEGTYWIDDLIGCKVYTESNECVGDVTGIIPTGANNVLELRSAEGKEILIPAVKHVLISVNIQEKKIIIRVMPGLLGDS